jgi:hypothetical protein
MFAASAFGFAALPAHGALALNRAMLDDGTCGQVLQMGSNITASRSSTPSFVLGGDGALSSYAMAIDGVSIGTFYSDAYSRVCIKDTIILRDGSHTLTGRELKPNAANAVTPFSFTVDTVAPPAPYGLKLDSVTDTGTLGDNLTTSRNLRIDGFATPGAPVHVLEGSLMRAGTVASSTGAWSATTTSLAIGTHTFTAVALDSAGNQSVKSAALTVTIGSVPSAPSAAAAGYDPSGVRVTWTVPYNGGWTINYYIIYRGTVSGGEKGYAAVLPTTSFIDVNTTRGVTYYYRVAAVNAIGLGSLSAEVRATAR